MRRRIPLAPAEGWLTLGLVLLMCLSLAWSVNSVKWVLGQDRYLDYLVYAAAGGVLAGFIGPKVGWGRWLTFLIGSIFAALLVPLATGLIVRPDGPLREAYQATAASVVAAWVDLAILRRTATTQYLHHVLTFGLLMWGTAMFASYAVFGHRRAMSAVVVIGVLLVLNMTYTQEDQLPLLVIYSLAALFLLIRSHVFDEQGEWLRRRIGDPATIGSVYLSGGGWFIVATVGLAVILTQTASSAPLAGAWNGMSGELMTVSRALGRYFPTGGETRPLGLDFGPNTRISGRWSTSSDLALTIDRDPTDLTSYYWRIGTWDIIEPTSWDQSPVSRIDRAAGAPLLDGMADDVAPEGRKTVTFTVHPASFRQSTIVSPETPVKVDQPVRVLSLGEAGYFTGVDRVDETASYTVTSLAGVEGNAPGEWNVASLRAAAPTVADADYPPEILALYATKPDASLIGPDTLLLERKIALEAGSQAPVDLAEQIVEELRDGPYFYDTDVTDENCAGLSTVECFARFKRGYCQYYAATMAVILRDMGIPTRIAQGFLPGVRVSPGMERVLFSNAHAWVEVWFPGYGWVTFDPTGGNLSGQIGALPSGKPVAASPSGSSGPGASGSPRILNVPERDLTGIGSAGGTSGGGRPGRSSR